MRVRRISPEEPGVAHVKIGISAVGPTLDDRVDERFGRAAYLIVIDSSSLAFEAVDNSANRAALQGSGIGAAETMSSREVEAVVTGHLGPKAFKALQAAGIQGFEGTGMTVREAVDAWVEGALSPLAEGEPHAGMM